MASLPEYFRAVEDAGDDTCLVSFSYDARHGTFNIAGRHVPVGDFDPYSFDPWKLGINDSGIDVRSIARYPLYMTALPGRLLATPRLHEWAAVNRRSWQELVEGARYIVGGVYLNIHGGEDEATDAFDTHFGSSVGLREGGGVHIQTIGNCACLGLAADGVQVRGLEDGFGEYELHNADTKAQRTSLYAGIGHLAHMASNV